MPTLQVIPIDVVGNVGPSLADAVVCAQVDTLILDRAPKLLHKHVVTPGASTIHRKLRTAQQNRLCKLLRRELATLIGVDDVRCAEAGKGLLHDLDRMAGLQGRRHLMREHSAAGHVDCGRQINKAFRHRNVSRIQCPHLIGLGDADVAQQLRIDRMS